MLSAELDERDDRTAADAQELSHIPGRDGWPLLGCTLAVVKDLHAVAADHVST